MPEVKLFASLRRSAGTKALNVPGKTLGQVLLNLAQQAPALAPILMENEALYPRVIATINGQTQDLRTGLNIPVQEQDSIAIFPPISGG
jgi:MoaD family protein